MFQKLVADARAARVAAIRVKEERRSRPAGLSTVELLKVASSALGIGPHHAMQLAERLYTQGYLSYPRTESTTYPASFEAREALAAHVAHPIWGDYVASLLARGAPPPVARAGHDAGDHPPITPMRSANEAELGGGDSWRVYDYVARHFIGSFSPDCRPTRTKVRFVAGGETFSCTGARVSSPGFTAVMPWLAVREEGLPPFKEGPSCAWSSTRAGRARPTT